jgi:adenosylcobinamide-GDP ribazoletransferase
VTRQQTPWWGPLALSVGFLTIIPMPAVVMSPAVAGRAAALFPLVGALIGLVLGGLGLLLDRFLPPGPVAALLLAAAALITGGLHLDGLMDTTDGIAGGRTPERRLAIMRDSRVGAIGAIAGILAILVQFASLSELSGQTRLLALVGAVAVSRWAMLTALASFPPALPDGLGATFRAGATPVTAVVGTLIVVAVALLTRPFGLVALGAGAVVTLIVGRELTRRLGGLTGDCYGAGAVVTETATLVIAVAVASS